jgi:hypothetical protein
MYSQVRLQDADGGRFYVTTVALPPEGESHSESLSLAYPSAALLGARVGDEIVWRSAGRLHRARIEEFLFRPDSPARRVRSHAQSASVTRSRVQVNARALVTMSPNRASEEVRT